MEPDSVTDDPQERWARLCRYLSKSVLAEMADTLVRLRATDKWFLHDTESEGLVTGALDCAAIPERLGKCFDKAGGHSACIYGWPTLVAMDRRHYPMIAPMFLVSVRPERRQGVWIGDAESEPEFNLSVVAGELFDLSMKDEIDAVVGDGLPFGDASSLANLAQEIADVLDIDIVSDLDPQSLDRRCSGAVGVHNTAIWVPTDDRRNAYRFLHDELEKLAHRRDWAQTAAAHLVPDRLNLAEPARQSPAERLAAPLPCNGSQELTLERFRSKPLTVVTGPPGTGKTQLVVNAVANAWLDGKKVLVASTNNGAVDVAVERANEICSGMLLRTGRRQDREELAHRATQAVAAASDGEVSSDGFKSVKNDARNRADLAHAAERRARLSADLAAAAALNRKLSGVVEDLERHARAIWNRARAPGLDVVPEVVARRAQRVSRAWFFRRWRARRLLRSVGSEVRDASLDDLALWAAVEGKRISLMDELSRTENRIGDPDISVRHADEQWAAASMTATQGAVRNGLTDGKDTLGALNRINPGGSVFSKAIRDCLGHARGWACTALSMQRSFRLESGLFDLAIIDEAGQCSLAVALPLAYRAKRLAVIGDPYQLTPIVTLSDTRLQAIAESERFADDDLAHSGIHHKDGSTYRAFERALVERDDPQPIVLDEHYRSHPHIARWFNREFYKGELTVLTDTATMPPDERSIGWIDVRGEARRGESGSWTNIAEAELVVHELADVIRNASGSLGVVTPFAAQALLIRRLAHSDERLGEEVLAGVDFECGTAHRFQGAERDVIVFSAVLAPNITERTAAWVERERNLVNVAVSRARKSLIVVGYPDIGTVGSPTLASLRSYLIEMSTDEGAVNISTTKFRTDSQAEARLLEAMRNAGFQPSAKLLVEGYELDFALLEQGLKLNVEVDGDHHVDARDKLRRQDIARDRVLARIGWEVIRIPAWRCIWDTDTAIHDIRTRCEMRCGRNDGMSRVEERVR